MKLSIIIPVYNEKQLIAEIVRRALEAPLPPGWEREIVIVDDGSDDGTTQLLAHGRFPPNVRVFSSLVNHGKGSALRVGFKLAEGDVFLIQDGDLEYDPVGNYHRLAEPFADESGRLRQPLPRPFYRGHGPGDWLANKLLTWLARLYRARTTDRPPPTRPSGGVLDRIDLAAEVRVLPEFTAKISKAGFRITEVPVTYRGRNRLQGKKIRVSDGVQAVYTLLRWRFRP
jgi:glycosyltransferase involved in cell wall biosynthesis